MSKDDSKEDRVTRIENLKRQVEKLVDGEIVSYSSEYCSLETEEMFWEYVNAFEKVFENKHGDNISVFDTLTECGVVLPHPDELNDEQLTKKLWEAIWALSLLGTYFYSTDHLSDREFYEDLWHELLREEYVPLPNDPSYACHLDIIGSGSMEDNRLYLKYYADEDERRTWANDFPEDDIPEHEDPPYDRDRHLPKRPGIETEIDSFSEH